MNIRKKILFPIVLGLCLLITFLFINTPYIEATTAKKEKTIEKETTVEKESTVKEETTIEEETTVEEESFQRIYDNADLLSTNEYFELEQLCTDYSEESGIAIIILTHNDSSAVDAEIYIENFYDELLFDDYPDSVILLVDMYNRDVCLEGYGLAETYIHSKRGDVIIDEISPYLSDEKYYLAFENYIERSAAYMKDDSELNYDHDYIYNEDPTSQSPDVNNYDPFSPNSDVYDSYPSSPNTSVYDSKSDGVRNLLSNVWFQIIISLVIGGIVVGVMAYNAGGKMTTGSNTYLDGNQSALIGKRDDYIRTRVTRIRKPTTNNTSGGGGFNAGGFRGGSSGGGHSHSTSRGKF